MKRLLTFFVFGLTLFVKGKPNDEPFIIGGEPVKPREFPEMVSIKLDGNPRCGGTILSEGWIMTIAHCMVYDASHYTVVAGTDDLNTYKGTNHEVSNIIIHQNYSRPDSWINDIAVFSVNPPINLGDINQAATLPKPDEVTNEGESATVIGYGSTEYEGASTGILRKANILVNDHDQCNTTYFSQFGLTVYDTQLCAGMAGGHGFCGFDTGGPLFVNGKVVGISSWTYKCAEPGYPEVFTEVSKYISWINENLKNI